MENTTKWIIAMSLICLVIFGSYGYDKLWGEEGGETTTQTTTQTIQQTIGSTTTQLTKQDPTKVQLPIENLTTSAKNKYTMAAITSGINVSFYEPGADVSDPNIEYLDIITPGTSGVGNTENMIIHTNTNYDIYLNGYSTYYDTKLGFVINYNRDTGKGYLLVNSKSYVPVVAFGAFTSVDGLPEVQTGWNDTIEEGCCGISTRIINETITVNTKTNYSLTEDNVVDNSVVIHNGTDMLLDEANWTNYTTEGYILFDGAASVDNGTTVNVTYNYTPSNLDSWTAYDESALGGSGWIRMDLGNNDANKEINQMVLCFGDADADMEGDELTGLTATYVSGSTKISLPGTLLTYWKEAMGSGSTSCLNIATHLSGSEKARWEFVFTVDEGNWEELNSASYTDHNTKEEFEIIMDDLGNYKQRQYPSSDVKATAKTLTVVAMS